MASVAIRIIGGIENSMSESKAVCPECFGKTILLRGKGLDSEYYVCSRWKEAGHLTEQ